MKRSFFKELKKTLSYCGGQRKFYAISLSALLIVDLIDVTVPFLISFGVDAAAGKTSSGWVKSLIPDSWFGGDGVTPKLYAFGLLYFAMVAGAGVLRYFMSFNISRATINISHETRNRLYAHVQALPAEWHDHATTGKIMSLATNDLDACRFFWGIGILLALDTLFYMIFTPFMMAQISLELTIACLIPAVLLMPYSIAKIANKIEEKFEHVQEEFSVLSEQASESFHGAKVVKSFSAEPQEVERYAGLARNYRRRSLSLAFWQKLEDPLLLFFIGTMQLVLIAYGGYHHLNGGQFLDEEPISTGEFVAFFFFSLRLAFPMIELGFVIMLYQRCVVSRRRIEEVLDAPASITSGPDAITPKECRGEIEFRDLSFTFKGAESPALENVSLSIPAGSTVAFMGEVGSGKSTILSLVSRLYDAPEGSIFIDGKSIRKLDLQWLRNQVAAVPQETFLFSETILENIGFGALAGERSEEELKNYARIARIEEDILGFPQGYQTLLGEKGVNLSGGQKQRIAIARALACRAPILVLDDCLSAVDAATEAAIFEALRSETGSRTCLIASHRASAVQHADKIVVLGRGRVIEQGTHEELMAAKGWYAELNRMQSLESAIEDQEPS